MNVHLPDVLGLRRRHWLGLGLSVGLLAACAQVFLPGLGDQRLQPEQFEQAVTAGSLNRNPVVRNVTVHVRGNSCFVTMDCLTRDPTRSTRAAEVYKYTPLRFDATERYVPREAPSQVVDLQINPGRAIDSSDASHADQDSAPLSINGSVAPEWASQMAMKGWMSHDNGISADPGDGAGISMGLPYGDYQLLVRLDASQADFALPGHMTINLNGTVLPKLTPTGELGVWRTTLSKDKFVLHERQNLHFAATGDTIKIRQLRIINPNYGVADFLAYVKGKYPDFDYEVGWLDNPKVAFPLFAGAGILLIGIIVPFALRIIIRMRELMLEAKKKRSAMASLVPGSPHLTIEDWMQIIELIAALETSLREVLADEARSCGIAYLLNHAAIPHPADTFVRREKSEVSAPVEEEPDKKYGCRSEDVYPTELGAAVGQVLYTSKETKELNNIFRLRSKKANSSQ